MHSRSDRIAELATLARQIHEGTISRRAFIGRALALGMSLSAADTIFRTYRAGAQDQAENPITVTVGGTPIAAIEPDLSNATPGGTLRFGRAVDSDNLDPVTNDGNVNIWYFMSIYDQLVHVGADGISLVPGLAESWDISEDGLTYTFHLRPNVVFSDGTPMTSADVIYSWVRAANDPEQHGPLRSLPSSATPTDRSKGSRPPTTRRSSSSWRSHGRRSSPTWRCSTCPSSPRRSPKDARSVSSRSAWGLAPSLLPSGTRVNRCAW